VGSGLIVLVVVKTSSTSWLYLSCRGAMGAIAKTLWIGRLGSWNDKVR
jgi:hypothetical protein